MVRKAPEKQNDATTDRLRWILEAVLWVWCIVGLGYFYYTQGFLNLFRQLWVPALG